MHHHHHYNKYYFCNADCPHTQLTSQRRIPWVAGVSGDPGAAAR